MHFFSSSLLAIIALAAGQEVVSQIGDGQIQATTATTTATSPETTPETTPAEETTTSVATAVVTSTTPAGNVTSPEVVPTYEGDGSSLNARIGCAIIAGALML